MISGDLNTTKNQYMASLLLKEDESRERSEQGRRASLGRYLYGYRQGVTQVDSSEEGIQRQKPLELTTGTFQRKTNITTDRLFLMRAPAITTLDLYNTPMVVSPNPPKAFAAQWEISKVLQPSVGKAEVQTASVGVEHTDISTTSYSHKRQILKQSAGISPWGSREAFQPRSLGAASANVTVDLEHTDESSVLNEIFAELETVVRWREEWGEEEEEHEPERPSEKVIERAQQVVNELWGVVVSADKPLHTPFISYDQDGYITMEWRNGKHELYLEIREDKIHYVKVWGINIDSEMDAGVPSTDNYLTLWEWLLNG